MRVANALSIRYVAALIIVATVLLTNHLLAVRQMRQVETDGHVINISGMQRMLSQRIALSALQLRSDPTVELADAHASVLEGTLARLGANHGELARQWRKRAADGDPRYIGYLGTGGLDGQVLDYLALGRRLLAIHRAGDVEATRASALAGRMATFAGSGFQERLDEVVFAYQREFEAKMNAIQRLETVMFFIGLLVLVLEALFIFRPMTSMIASSIAALEHANGELRAFSYRVSHDLRAPVASSLGLIELVHESIEEGDTEEAGESVGMIRESLTRLDALIVDLLALVRTQQIAESSEPVDLRAVLDEVLGTLSFMPGFERVAIRTRVEVDGPVHTKPVLLRQVLQNLLSNAIKYADPTRASSVDVAVRREGRGEVRVSISDNGIGIPEGSREEVFGMFKRFHPKIASGSGLGLYLVECSAREMGGHMDYTPLAEGSTFVLNFPERPPGAKPSTSRPSC